MKNKARKGIEPISITDYVIALPLSYPAKFMESLGVDPRSFPCKGNVLPLNYDPK